jgi:hypothetical protein
MMQNAWWLASIFGPMMVVLGVWMLMYADHVSKVVAAMKGAPAILFARSYLDLFLGFFILSYYNAWFMDLPFLVTLLGWVLVVRGILTLFVPQLVIKWTMTHPMALKRGGIIPLVWGLALCYLAFYAP